MRTFKCDRCLAEYVPDKRIQPLILSKSRIDDSGRSYKFDYADLCPICMFSLRFWLEDARTRFKDHEIGQYIKPGEANFEKYLDIRHKLESGYFADDD